MIQQKTLYIFLAVDLFTKLSKLSETAHVQLKSQQKSRIKEHEVIRFTLAIELAPPTIKQTLNLKTQKKYAAWT